MLLRFGNGVTLGDEDFDALFFGDLLAVGVNFFNCSILCVGLFTWSKDRRLRVIIFVSLNSATSALRVRCIITFSLESTFKRSNLTRACESRCRFRRSGVDRGMDFGDAVLFSLAYKL